MLCVRNTFMSCICDVVICLSMQIQLIVQTMMNCTYMFCPYHVFMHCFRASKRSRLDPSVCQTCTRLDVHFTCSCSCSCLCSCWSFFYSCEYCFRCCMWILIVRVNEWLHIGVIDVLYDIICFDFISYFICFSRICATPRYMNPKTPMIGIPKISKLKNVQYIQEYPYYRVWKK